MAQIEGTAKISYGLREQIATAAAYMFVSCSLTLVNKEILASQQFTEVNLLVASQQICVLGVLALLHRLGLVTLKNQLVWPDLSELYLMANFIGYVLTSLYGLRFVSIPLYTTLRKTGIATTALLEYNLHQAKFSPLVLTSIVLVISGAVVAGLRICAIKTW